MRPVGLASLCAVSFASLAHGSDHLDTPTVIADPAGDIADLFAWNSADGAQLNLAMTVVAHTFSDKLAYVFHIDSGARFGATTAALAVVCRFTATQRATCWAGDADHADGDASQPSGLTSQRGRFRVFAGLRDDPFANNVRGTRAALDVAAAALAGGVVPDATGCTKLSAETSRAMFDRWQHTDGGPANNFLEGWTSAALVISIDHALVTRGGPLVAVWAETATLGAAP